MNGIEITRMLRMIDQNMAENDKLVEAEILAYMEHHQDDLLRDFAQNGVAIIPTSVGDFRITGDLLEKIEGVAA